MCVGISTKNFTHWNFKLSEIVRLLVKYIFRRHIYNNTDPHSRISCRNIKVYNSGTAIEKCYFRVSDISSLLYFGIVCHMNVKNNKIKS